MKLNRNLWKGCGMCMSEYPLWYLMNSSDKFEPSFCPNYGRPRTEMAWKELEQRVAENLQYRNQQLNELKNLTVRKEI